MTETTEYTEGKERRNKMETPILVIDIDVTIGGLKKARGYFGVHRNGDNTAGDAVRTEDRLEDIDDAIEMLETLRRMV